MEKLIQPVKILVRQILSLFIEDAQHILVPYDARIVGKIKGSWTKTKLTFTIDRSIIPDDIFNFLDTDTVRTLVHKNGFLCTEDYILVVPSDFDVRGGDWEVYETNVKITVKLVKISINLPTGLFDTERIEFSLGVYEDRLYFSITQKKG